MSKYFISTQYNEYIKQQKCLGIKIGKAIPTIDMISIGIVGKDYEYAKALRGGSPSKPKTIFKHKEYYAISKDFNIKDAWNNYRITGIAHKEYWIRDNILKPIFEEIMELSLGDKVGSYPDNWFNLKDFTKLIKLYGKTKEQIVAEIIQFTIQTHKLDDPNWNKSIDVDYPVFYGYNSAYDWVVLRQLFGTKNNLPIGFPKDYINLKQLLDEKAESLTKLQIHSYHNGLEKLKDNIKYPKLSNEHNALSKAKWNKKLYKFIKQL